MASFLDVGLACFRNGASIGEAAQKETSRDTASTKEPAKVMHVPMQVDPAKSPEGRQTADIQSSANTQSQDSRERTKEAKDRSSKEPEAKSTTDTKKERWASGGRYVRDPAHEVLIGRSCRLLHHRPSTEPRSWLAA